MTDIRGITLDCIIFGLQRFGGISNYWARLVEYANADGALSWNAVLPKHVTYQEFDASSLGRMTVSRERVNAMLSRYLRSSVHGDAHVFHTSYYRLPRRKVAKYVVSAYDFTYERYRRGLARRIHSTQKLASIRRADAVLCISESTRRDILEFCPDVDAARLHVVHLGVDRARFFRETSEGSACGRADVLFVGQRGGYKRFDLAVEAVRQSSRLTLAIVGPPLTPSECAYLQERLAGRWREHASVAAAELRRLYASAFAFVFPSDYEGFGLPMLEAMACGCPVVAANRSSLPEVGGDAAEYASSQTVEAYAEALHALDTPSRRDVLIEAGLARVEHFSWARNLQETAAIYLR